MKENKTTKPVNDWCRIQTNAEDREVQISLHNLFQMFLIILKIKKSTYSIRYKARTINISFYVKKGKDIEVLGGQILANIN